MAVSNRTRQKWAASRRDPNFQKQVAELVDAQRADPFSYSALPYWLGLEVWTRDEGLYILAGVEPGTVSYEDDDSLRFLT